MNGGALGRAGAWQAALIFVAWLPVGCGSGVFACSDDADCNQSGNAGTCEPQGGCSFPDGLCESGQRYGEHANPRYAGKCVPAPEPEPGAPSETAGSDGTTGGAGDGGTASTAESSTTIDSATTTSTSDGASTSNGASTSDGASTSNGASTSGLASSTSATSVGSTTGADVSGSTSEVGCSGDGCQCPCSIWDDATVPTTTAASEGAAVELGVRFQPTIDGFITAIRFYKGIGNDGTHVGSLWTASGVLLGQVTFGNETATGWQQAALAEPVFVEAGSTYVASYFAPQGRYAFDTQYFATAGVDSPPLRALADGEDGFNGVFLYGGGFPVNGFQATNYWVDVVFEP